MSDGVKDTRFTLQAYREMEPLETAWRALEAAPEIGVHQTYDWCRIWLAHSEHPPLIIVARFSDSEELAFILPLMIEKRGPIRVARYMSALFNNLNFGLFSIEFLAVASVPIMQQIQSQIATLPLGVDAIVLDRQPAHWRGFRHPFTLVNPIENQNLTFQVTLEDGIDAVLAYGNAKRRRKKVRVSERRLDALGGFEYIRAESADEAQQLLDAFFDQKKERFGTKGIPDIFAPSATKAFLRKLAAESIGSERKLIEMHAIRLADGTLCALSALSRKGGHVICQFSSIKPGKTERASPGELLFFLTIRSACESGDVMFDFGVGDEQFKRSWCNLETKHYDTTIAVTPLGHATAAAARTVVIAKRMAKSNPVTFRLAKAMRFLVRR